VSYIDIGGGLPVDYFPSSSTTTRSSSSSSSSGGGSVASCPFAAYRAALEAAVPLLFTTPNRIVVTEFGKAIVATAAIALCSVQDVIPHGEDEGYTCILHAGADLLLRESYCPDHFRHRMILVRDGRPLLHAAPDSAEEGRRVGATRVTLSGPLCFSGDTLGDIWLQRHQGVAGSGKSGAECSNRYNKTQQRKEEEVMGEEEEGRPRVGDWACVFDCGANSLSLFSRHCSRQAPAVWVVNALFGSEEGTGKGEEEGEGAGAMAVACVKRRETVDDVLRFWS
jgi:diaminopimelate decarboxylase